jgi:hypothetical protein
MQVTAIPPQTAAVATKQQIPTNGYASCVLSADLLAGSETVGVFIMAGNTWLPVLNSSGAAVTLTTAVPVVELTAGPMYGVTKDATVGNCGVYADLGTCVR